MSRQRSPRRIWIFARPLAGGRSQWPIMVIAQINHERSVNNPGLHASGHPRSGLTHGSKRIGHQSRVFRGEHGVEMPQSGLTRPGPPTPRASIKPALVANHVHYCPVVASDHCCNC